MSTEATPTPAPGEPPEAAADLTVTPPEIEVEFEDGGKETVRVRQIKVSEYRKALAMADDELALIAIATGKDTQWVERLKPLSFEHLITAFRAISWAFFAYCERTIEDRLARMPKDMAANLFAAAQSGTTARRSQR